jgi:arylsulfatase A-like enzyme
MNLIDDFLTWANKMKKARNLFYLFSLLCIIVFQCAQPDKNTRSEPNIIILYADDLGYGDLSCYGATALNTPNIDRIAREGIRFTNAYATSATCTPSRYALLTGEYPWRNQQARILPGNAPLIINPAKPNLLKIVKKAGYTTGVIGKWHLGLGGENLDWNGVITPGPNEIGFDYSFILASTNDRVPTVYVENGKVVGLNKEDPLEVSYAENFPGEPTGKDHPELLKMLPSHGHDMSIHNGISRIGYMRGGKSALWVDEVMGDTILSHSMQFIQENVNNPFFLYYAFHEPHVPRTPNPRFVGSTDMGPRGDAILEIDYAVGQVLDLLDSLSLTDHTMIIFSSDNGPVLDDGYQDEAVIRIGDHHPSGILRGGKYSLFDAGTHLPFMVRWKGHINPGTSDALLCQMDLAASLAAILGQDNPTKDSQDMLNAILGKSAVGRDNLVLEASGNTCYLENNWVMIPPYQGPEIFEHVQIESGLSSGYQLYHLKEDPSQKHNLADEYPDILAELMEKYEMIVSPKNFP